MIPIKTAAEIERMRDACRIAANVLEAMKAHVREGISTYELDQLARGLMLEEGATSACYQYQVGSRRFPSYTCISVNEEVVHGVASLKRVLQHGDIVALDVTVVYQGYIGDNACTVRVGEVSSEIDRLVVVTEEAMYAGIAQARTGHRVGDISHAVQRYVESRGYSVVREYVGHGVGRTMHEEPQIPNFGRKGKGEFLKPGMTLAIEPMVNLGRPEVDVLADGWTVVTRDRKPSAHFEHTVLVTSGDPEILTLPSPRSISSRCLSFYSQLSPSRSFFTMPRLLGVEIPPNKKVEYALRYIYGIGPQRARLIVEHVGIEPTTRAHDLSEEQLNRIMTMITERKWVVEGDLRREIAGNLKRLQAINCYRGQRHRRGLPVRGQRTQTNARTRKGTRRTVGVVRAKA